jgi:hypothetical protein
MKAEASGEAWDEVDTTLESVDTEPGWPAFEEGSAASRSAPFRRSIRLEERPVRLLRAAMGAPRDFVSKMRRLLHALHEYGQNDRVEARLRRLHALGYIDEVPTQLQRIVGAVDMMRFFIVPAARDYYDSIGINFRFHSFLRFLDDPASMIDPTGLNSSRDAIIGHVMQVVHANPHYDFQLLESFEDGLEQMQQQVESVLDGTHPRTRSIQAVVEDPEYHARLLQHVKDYRRDRKVPPLLRENLVSNPRFAEVQRTFGTLPNAMRYFAHMPKTLAGAVEHLRRVREFPRHLAAHAE